MQVDSHIELQPQTVRFLGVRFDRMTQPQAVDLLLEGSLARESRQIFFANAHTMNLCYTEPPLRPALEAADLLLADGSGVLWGSKLVGRPLTYNLNGTDLIPALAKAGAPRGLSIYLLGAKPGVADDAAANLLAAYPGLTIAGRRDGYLKHAEIDAVLAEIRAAKPHVLLVAMGVPNQELWIARHAGRLPGVTCIGVGGLFDFLAQRVKRAPRFVRAIGMEWAWRMMMEPRRLWKRYLVGNVIYFGHLLRHGWKKDPRKSPAGPNHPGKLSRPQAASIHADFKASGNEVTSRRRSA